MLFDPIELTKVKLEQSFADGSHRSRKTPQFTGEGGVEALLFVKERFDHHCDYLNFTEADELFDNFDACLEGRRSDEVGRQAS